MKYKLEIRTGWKHDPVAKAQAVDVTGYCRSLDKIAPVETNRRLTTVIFTTANQRLVAGVLMRVLKLSPVREGFDVKLTIEVTT